MPHHIQSPSRPLLSSGPTSTNATRIEAERRPTGGGVLEHKHSMTVQALQAQGPSRMNCPSQHRPNQHQTHQLYDREQQNIVERRMDDRLTRVRSHSVEQYTHASFNSACSSRSSPRLFSYVQSGNGMNDKKAHDVRLLMLSEPNEGRSGFEQHQPNSNLQNHLKFRPGDVEKRETSVPMPPLPTLPNLVKEYAQSKFYEEQKKVGVSI